MAERKRIYKWYLILAIIYSFISILTGIIFFMPSLLLPIMLIWGPVVIIWSIFNIVLFILILVKKMEKVALWLPGLYIFDQIFSAIVGIIFGVIATARRIEPAVIIQNPLFGALSLIFPIITLIIAIKLILRK